MACFLNNISAKYYENPTMLSRVTAKNVVDVFLRHSVLLYLNHLLIGVFKIPTLGANFSSIFLRFF